MSAPDLGVLAREAAEWMRGREPGVEAEVFVERGEERSLTRRDGARDGVESAQSRGAGVRVIRDGRVGFASAGGADAEALRGLYARAVEQLDSAETDARRRLPVPVAAAKEDSGLAASLWDEALFTRTWTEIEDSLARAESAALSAGSGLRALRSSWTESRGETAVASTTGVFARERGGSASLSVDVAAERKAETQLGEAWRGARRLAALDPEALGREAARLALAQLGARRARGGRKAVVFEPRVAVEFLELLESLLSAEEVQGGRSLLAGRLGKVVASPLVTLRDEPRRLGALGSCAYDDEGLATLDKVLIDAGVLREYLHDAETAAREGRASNACAFRGSYAGLPSPGASNLYLAPGTATREGLVASTKDGILPLEVLGLHMADPVSGEFSVGVSGLAIEAGALGRPVKGAMISGNLLDLLARVDAVADDLEFHGAHGSPTFRVAALDVA